ncbi:hypothetical protein BGZ83_011035 [Gryganskiella cystojenkinii]|nr:hypothetical protein BGZ83_011035 [Gryganskiella cystojenkinii]
MNSLPCTITINHDSKTPFEIEFVGEPTTDTTKVSGTVELHVTKKMKLKHFSVAFFGGICQVVGSVVNKPNAMNNIVVQLIDEPTEFQPGTKTYPFQIEIPGDLTTTDSRKLKYKGVYWRYQLIATAIPNARLSKKMEVKNDFNLRRMYVPPPSTSLLTSLTENIGQTVVGRRNEIRCSVFSPKTVAILDHIGHDAEDTRNRLVDVKVKLFPQSDQFQATEVRVKAVQKEQIRATQSTFDASRSRLFKEITYEEELKWKADEMFGDTTFMAVMVNRSTTKDISKEIVLKNPLITEGGDSDLGMAWGRDAELEFELELDPNAMLSTEKLSWIQVTHSIQVQVILKDSKKSVSANIPFQYLKFVETTSENVTSDLANKNGSNVTLTEVRGEN